MELEALEAPPANAGAVRARRRRRVRIMGRCRLWARAHSLGRWTIGTGRRELNRIRGKRTSPAPSR